MSPVPFSQNLAANSARLIRSVAATSDANGMITFLLGPAETGLVYEGNCTVPNAPSGALFVATILSTNWQQWAGSTNAGPFQLWGGETLQVIGTGLTPNTSYVLTMFGVSLPEEYAVPSPPAAPMSVVSVETATLLVNGVTVASNGSINIHPPSLTRRLTVIIDGTNLTSTNVTMEIAGDVSTALYFSTDQILSGPLQPPLFAAIEPSVDPTYTISFLAFNGTIKVWVLASVTNPLIEGNPSSPIPIVPSGSNTFDTYPFLDSSFSATVASPGVTGQTVVNAPGGLNWAMLGTLSIQGSGGACSVQLTNGVGNIFWAMNMNLGDGPNSFPVLRRTTSAVLMNIVCGGTIRVSLTYGDSQ